MQTFDLLQLAHFDNAKPRVQIIARSEHARHMLFAFRAGQGLSEHQTSSQIMVQVLTGSITFSAKGQQHTLIPGQLLTLEASVPHRVHAEVDTIMLLTMTPDPKH